ncbi:MULTISPECIES: molybdate ABC transporter substrate-binding protein [Brevibacterium]|jgi:molybdate transport system substrate-binding protein|uniref:Molybdate ABC transporter substrate-binding protein n=1 Tax=Brevibacterium salitolerans TaxID=1403566 RepID=A0ABN2WKD0_9MICO|nr:molybdate ABC transporter substrate-binding protein [Brevibacterium sp.]
MHFSHRPPRRTVRIAAAALAAGLLIAPAGCASGPDSSGGGDSEGGEAEEPRTLTVFAAASLTDTFEQLTDAFSEQHDGVDVQLSFAGSSDLVAQITEGAPADVVATADERTMQQLVDDSLLTGEPTPFVTNVLEIAVPEGNPEGVSSLTDLANPDLDVVVCAPQVPCGAATEKVEEASGVRLSPVSEEPQVTDVLGKVAGGQADAGLVYRTDAAGSDAVEGIAFPEAQDAVNTYPIAPVADSASPALAQEFVDFVLSEEGWRIFEEAGFTAP